MKKAIFVIFTLIALAFFAGASFGNERLRPSYSHPGLYYPYVEKWQDQRYSFQDVAWLAEPKTSLMNF